MTSINVKVEEMDKELNYPLIDLAADLADRHRESKNFLYEDALRDFMAEANALNIDTRPTPNTDQVVVARTVGQLRKRLWEIECDIMEHGIPAEQVFTRMKQLFPITDTAGKDCNAPLATTQPSEKDAESGLKCSKCGEDKGHAPYLCNICTLLDPANQHPLVAENKALREALIKMDDWLEVLHQGSVDTDYWRELIDQALKERGE